MISRISAFVVGTVLIVSADLLVAAEATHQDFDSVATILSRHCIRCHNDSDSKGGLSLADSEGFHRGGESGSFVDAKSASESLFLQMILGDEPDMPKDAPPLSKAEQKTLIQWVTSGAKWPDDYVVKQHVVENVDWWSLKPLQRPEIPTVSPEFKSWATTPIDAFILRKLGENKLSPSVQADRRTLIRRLFFDLIGLPPTPGEVHRFLNDQSTTAYSDLVERLLSSKHYGERWARHWLDVVHYGDTHGYDKDKLRPNAFPYRDYVIRSLNRDKPYARFVMEQIAGDVLWPETVDGIEATGFIAAGPWDFIGHAEVPETKIDGQIARNLDRDDMVSSTMNTFASTTIQCARCHNHKFDPITQEHYYSLQAVFAALDRADRLYDKDPSVAKKRKQLTDEQKAVALKIEKVSAEISAICGEELVSIEKQIAEAEKDAGKEKPEFGFHSQISSTQDATKWVQVDLGEPTNIRTISIVGCKDDFNGIGKGFGFPIRFRIEVSNDSKFETAVSIVDQTHADFANPGVSPQEFKVEDHTAQFVRVTATRLALRADDYIFALAELSVYDNLGANVAIGKEVSSLDSIEQPVRWSRKNLVDGYYFGVNSKHEEELKGLRQRRTNLLADRVPASLRQQRSDLDARLQQIQQAVKSLPMQQKVYAGTIHHGSGAFRGTGHDGGRPRAVYVLHRGDIGSRGKQVGPGTIPIIQNTDWQFRLPNDHSEGQRRVELARWLVRKDNPLTWRSIVNRIWQYHFGRGIVATPNDFGRMGQEPTHPELLDWLAIEFRDGRQSIKDLHRLIVNSSAYRQVSDDTPDFTKIDANNRFLWRMNRRALDAESIRDTTLYVSGKLNRKMFGPAFRDFVLERPEHSPHYEYHKRDPNDESTHRRSVYRFLVRSQQDPFMQTLDCADPSQSIAKRDTTITAIQALTLLNNKFMVCMSEHFADRLSANEADLDSQIENLFQIALNRSPSPVEAKRFADFASHYGLANSCRAVFNLNEFVFVD